MKKPSQRAGAVEGLVIRFAEDRPRPPLKPFLLTYVGPDVEEVPEVGLFQHGTTAEVDAVLAEEMRGRDGWEVSERPASEAEED